MRTVSSKVSKREHAAIVQYANQTGESVSNLIRKVLISDAVFGDSFGEIPVEYSIDRYPADTEEDTKDQVLEEQVKEIKMTLGWKDKPTLINKIVKGLREESELISEEESD
ncbi:MAG: hypothetical protein EX285_05140 [Thaumarchaeota archaeon]|nr:hypothetical protein [Nitrososphaerota archaeon]